MNRLLLEVAAGAVALSIGVIGYNLWQNAERKAAAQSARADAAEANLEKEKENAKLDHENHKRELAIAGQRDATERGLRNVCHQIRLPVTPAGPDGTARTDAPDGQLAQLAGEILSCRKHASRLSGLQEWARRNSRP